MSTFVPEVRPLGRSNIETEAQLLLRRFAPVRLTEPGPVDVLRVLEDYVETLKDDGESIEMRIVEMGPGEEGALYPNGVIVLSEATHNGACQGKARPRFTIGHETGHLVLHRKQIRRAFVERAGVSVYRRADLKPFLDPEWQANAFAAALLMPAGIVKKLVAEYGGFSAISVIERELKVSNHAARYRVAHFEEGKLRVK